MASTDKLEAFLAEPRNVVVAGIRRDGRPHLSPNWFYWDGQRFYVSTTRDRVKYAIFRRDPRAQLLIDDPTAFRAVLIPATVEIREDIAAELPRFRAIREKHGMAVLDEEEHLRALAAEGRVLLAITPDGPPSARTGRRRTPGTPRSRLCSRPATGATGTPEGPGAVASLTRLRGRGRCYSPIRHFAANPRLLSIPLSSLYMIISWMSLYDRNVILAG
jgi:PPOX class probable F420-dependent enzyme